jgi:hypothetical protein
VPCREAVLSGSFACVWGRATEQTEETSDIRDDKRLQKYAI